MELNRLCCIVARHLGVRQVLVNAAEKDEKLKVSEQISNLGTRELVDATGKFLLLLETTVI